MTTKAKLIVGNQSIELEGSEEFVEKHLASFRKSIDSAATPPANPNGSSLHAEDTNTDVSPRTIKRTKKSKSIQLQEFELRALDGKPSLEQFMKNKQPGNTAKLRILLIAYYVTRIRGTATFTEGHIDYAYRTLGLTGRPQHLRQIIINCKNEHAWFDLDDGSAAWKVTRSGEIYVDEKLPPKVEK